MFQTDLLSIIRVFILYSQQLVSSFLTSLAVNITSMTNISCCKYSIETPDDGQ
jgi:hypothetical protein